MENLDYKFQKEKDEKFKKLLDNQILTFCKRISIQEQYNKMPDADKRLLYVLGYENIMNIIWYKNHIWKEQLWRVLYFSISLTLLLALPIVIWCITFKFIPNLDNPKAIGTGETIIAILSIILTSILAIHKFISSWLEKRKFLSQFYQTFTELKNILFRIENDWKDGKAIDVSTNELSDDFKISLNQAISDSRKLVAIETKQYFETLSYPNIDISSLLSNSSTSAISLITNFKSKKLDLEKLRKEVEFKQDAIKQTLLEIKNLEIEVKIKKEKVAALEIDKDNKSKSLVEKSQIEHKTEFDKQEIKQIETDLKSILTKLSSLQVEIIEIESELIVKKQLMNKNAT